MKKLIIKLLLLSFILATPLSLLARRHESATERALRNMSEAIEYNADQERAVIEQMIEQSAADTAKAIQKAAESIVETMQENAQAASVSPQPVCTAWEQYTGYGGRPQLRCTSWSSPAISQPNPYDETEEVCQEVTDETTGAVYQKCETLAYHAICSEWNVTVFKNGKIETDCETWSVPDQIGEYLTCSQYTIIPVQTSKKPKNAIVLYTSKCTDEQYSDTRRYCNTWKDATVPGKPGTSVANCQSFTTLDIPPGRWSVLFNAQDETSILELTHTNKFFHRPCQHYKLGKPNKKGVRKMTCSAFSDEYPF